MGLGLHGGGTEAALFFARNGARVTVTDLKDEAYLAQSMERLSGYPIRFVLGRHELADFVDTDLVIKNPGVRETSKFIQAARSYGVRVESDISVFVSMTENPIIAITGSKGKSTVASAIHYCLAAVHPDAKLGGNITVSPLGFVNLIPPHVPVVLELSSWQLADLAANPLFKPRVSLMTNILPDHMNWYANMEDYLSDKKVIYRYQGPGDASIFNLDDPRLAPLFAESKAKSYFFSSRPLPDGMTGAYLDCGKGWLSLSDAPFPVLPERVALPGPHNRMNLLAAGLASALAGLHADLIAERLAGFPGIEHRLERFFEKDGISFYNDSAATIPHATAAALRALEPPVYLITGGTDKNIDFAPLFEVAGIPERIYLLEGNATVKMIAGLKEKRIAYAGPFTSLEDAVGSVLSDAKQGANVLFSPACASFGMFLNEFDRGRKFKACVLSMANPEKL